MDLDLGPEGYLTQSSLNESFAIQTENTNDIQPLNSAINPYQQLQPLVQELYTAMDGTFNIGDIVRIKEKLNDEALEFKHRETTEIHGISNPPGQLVSSKHPSCKDKRTHHAVY